MRFFPTWSRWPTIERRGERHPPPQRVTCQRDKGAPVRFAPGEASPSRRVNSSRRHQGVKRVGVDAVEDEVGVAASLGQLGAAALAPVPAATGHAAAVGPDHLARFRVLDDLLAAADERERLVAGREAQRRVARELVEILAADRQDMPDADGVVEIDDAIDSWQILAFQHAAQERFDRAGVLAGLRTEAAERLRQAAMCGWVEGFASPKQRRIRSAARSRPPLQSSLGPFFSP